MDSGVAPEFLAPGYVSHLRNASIRGGRVTSRPRFIERATLPAGKIQGAAAFNDRGVLLVSIDGRVYEIDPGSWVRTEKTSDADRNNPNRPRHWFCETVGSIVIQDDQSQPIIYDGDQFRRAEDDEVPVGAMMNFSNGRLCVAVANRRAVRIGDIRQEDHQSELKFTETYGLSSGGDFAFPARVTCITSLPVIDTSTGQGSTIVGCRGRFFSLKTQVATRDLWPDIGFQTEVFPGVGITGARAAARSNQDLFFRAGDGLRTFRATVSDFESYGLVPISREVAHRMEHDDESFLEDAQVALFDNRILFTHSPILYGNRYINLGLGSYNLDSISRAGQKAAPGYDGEWDGLQIAEIVVGNFSGKTRCFVVGRDVTGANGIWEIPKESTELQGDEPEQEVVTGALVGDGIGILKTLQRLDLFLSKISSDCIFTAYWRPDDYSHWVKWGQAFVEASVPAGWGRAGTTYRGPVMVTTPPEVFDETQQRYLHQGRKFQIRVKWTGRARINAIRTWMSNTSEPALAMNVENGKTEIPITVPEGQETPVFWFPYTSKPTP